jgi:hypothetical protein
MVVPFDEVSFAIDLPSKEKAQPPRMLRAARHALRLSTPMGSFPRLGPASGTDGTALPILATDGLADELNSHLALLKRLARELLKELRIEGVLSGVDVRIAVRAPFFCVREGDRERERERERPFLSLSNVFVSLVLVASPCARGGLSGRGIELIELFIDAFANVALSHHDSDAVFLGC